MLTGAVDSERHDGSVPVSRGGGSHAGQQRPPDLLHRPHRQGNSFTPQLDCHVFLFRTRGLNKGFSDSL